MTLKEGLNRSEKIPFLGKYTKKESFESLKKHPDIPVLLSMEKRRLRIFFFFFNWKFFSF